MTQNKTPATLKTLGLTGEIAAGKSEVSAMLRESGGAILDADEIAHEVILKGTPAYGEILAHISGGYLDDNGEIDRRRLGEIVFAAPEYLRILENAIHKHVIMQIERAVLELNAAPEKRAFIVIDAPLLIESGLDKMCDAVWVVEAPREIRVARLIERNRLTEAQAEKRVASRRLMAPEGSVVIENGGSLVELGEKVTENLTEFLGN